MRRDVGLYPWFMHKRLVLSLPGFKSSRLADQARWWFQCRFVDELQTFTAACDEWLTQKPVPSLQRALIRDDADAGALVWLEAEFDWSDVANERRGAGTGRSSFRTVVDVGGAPVGVEGTFNPTWLTCSTSNVELRGRRLQYMLATVAARSASSVELRPIVIAARLFAPREWEGTPQEWQEVSLRQLDQLGHVDWNMTVTSEDLEVLRLVPEASVKHLLANLIGEDVIPKDWGGEQCDLWTTRLLIDGRAHSAAFLLKGPAQFRPMSIASLGRQGDQLDRLSKRDCRVVR